MSRHNLRTGEQDAINHVRMSSISEHNVANFFERVKRNALDLDFAELNEKYNYDETTSIATHARDETRHRVSHTTR